MIIDLAKFVATERPFWTELESFLSRLELEPDRRLGLEQSRRFHYLYERASADLGRVSTFASEPELRRYLEGLVARAYSEVHEMRSRQHRVRPRAWLWQTFPQTFRRHARAFYLSVALTILGCMFGALAVGLDPAAKGALLPFGHGQMDPADRVAREEHDINHHLDGAKGTFSAQLMQNNIGVSIRAMALGMTWGVGTIILLFYNGVILGGIVVDYMMAGQSRFLAGWLLPHGSIEIPAILIAGQAGLVLAGALIGWGSRTPLAQRMRLVMGDLFTLILGVALLLVWAGLIESFFSQYHEPVLPYSLKIAFGLLELIALTFYLGQAGRSAPREGGDEHGS